MRRVWLLFLMLYSIVLNAQNELEKNTFLQEELYGREWTEEQNETLIELTLRPLDLNNSSKEELEASGLFSPDQIEGLLFYLYVFGEMKTIYELKMVKHMDYQSIQRILPYVTITPFHREKKDYLNQSINLALRSFITLPDGFKHKNDSLVRLSKKYLGDPLYCGLLYDAKLGRHLRWGIAMEKDAGENITYTPDYMSFYLQFSSSGKGFLKDMLIGSYKLRFGQGLVMNTTYDAGYSSLQTFQENKASELRKHNSFSEYGFHRGLAVALELKDLRMILFGSANAIDATFQDSVITSFSQSGKHNTRKTIERKNNERITSLGGNVHYQIKQFNIGFCGVVNRFSKTVLVGNETLANRFHFRGINNTVCSFHWSYRNRFIHIYGEEAYGNKSFAFINSLILQPRRELLFSFSQRYYAPRFYSFYGRSMGNNQIRNEEGYYFYTSLYAGYGFYLSGSLDYYRNLWAVAASDFPKDAADLRVKIENRKLEKWNLSFQYKHIKREKEIETDHLSGYMLLPDYRSVFSFRTTFEYSSNFLSQSLIEYAFIKNKDRYSGFHLSQIFTWQTIARKLKMQGIISVFDGDEGITFYTPLRHALYSGTGERTGGQGYKIQINISYLFHSNFSSNLSYSFLYKSDSYFIGNGLERIEGSQRQLLSFVFRYKF